MTAWKPPISNRENETIEKKFIMTIEAYKYKPSVEECKAIFVASCIETTAKATGMTPEAMYQRMVRIGLIKDYILPCYNVLHSESRQHITEDILKTIEIWEKKKGVAL